MSWIAVLLTLTGLILNARKVIFCWPIWILGDILWIFLYSSKREWPIVVINSIFLFVNVLGWYSWYKDEK